MTRSRVRELRELRDDVARVVKHLDDGTIAELVHRGEHLVRDGYPSSSRSVEGHGEGDHGDPVLSFVEQDDPPDRVAQWLDELLVHLRKARRELVSVDRRRGLVLRVQETAQKQALPAGAGHCLCCGAECVGLGEDRLRSGYCPKCWKAWVRAGRPDRHAFERDRRASLVPNETAGGRT